MAGRPRGGGLQPGDRYRALEGISSQKRRRATAVTALAPGRLSALAFGFGVLPAALPRVSPGFVRAWDWGDRRRHVRIALRKCAPIIPLALRETGTRATLKGFSLAPSLRRLRPAPCLKLSANPIGCNTAGAHAEGFRAGENVIGMSFWGRPNVANVELITMLFGGLFLPSAPLGHVAHPCAEARDRGLRTFDKLWFQFRSAFKALNPLVTRSTSLSKFEWVDPIGLASYEESSVPGVRAFCG
jgi:hypothetical protein